MWGGGIEFSHKPQDWWGKKKIDHHLHTAPAFLNLSLYPKADCQIEVLCQQNSTLQLFVCNPISFKSWTYNFRLFCFCILSGIFLTTEIISFFSPKDTRVWLRRHTIILTLKINIPWHIFSQRTCIKKSSLFCRTVLSTSKHLITISSFWQRKMVKLLLFKSLLLLIQKEER